MTIFLLLGMFQNRANPGVGPGTSPKIQCVLLANAGTLARKGSLPSWEEMGGDRAGEGGRATVWYECFPCFPLSAERRSRAFWSSVNPECLQESKQGERGKEPTMRHSQ